jgi:hypothetical protein
MALLEPAHAEWLEALDAFALANGTAEAPAEPGDSGLPVN